MLLRMPRPGCDKVARMSAVFVSCLLRVENGAALETMRVFRVRQFRPVSMN